jgi:hypothetical protein
MIAHGADRAACVDHSLDDVERFSNCRSSIDQIADKDCDPLTRRHRQIFRTPTPGAAVPVYPPDRVRRLWYRNASFSRTTPNQVLLSRFFLGRLF